MLRSLLFIFFISIITSLSAQTCLQKLDSAEKYKYTYPEKAQFFAQSLLIDLDSGKCIEAIGIAGVYNNLGLILWETNDKKQGLNAFLSGLDFELKSKDSTDAELLGLYYNLTTAYMEAGQFQAARSYLDLAERIVVDAHEGNTRQQIKFLLTEGIYFRETGEFRGSIEALNEAIELAAFSTDSVMTSLQIELGTTFRHFGELESGEEALMKAIEMAKGRNDLLYLKAIDRLSTLKIEEGEYSDSENYLLFNLEEKSRKFPGDPFLKLETLNELGFLYYRLNDLTSASTYINQALDIGESIQTIKPYMINNLGTIYMKQGMIDEAEKCFEESSQGFKELFGGINPDYSSSLNNLAAVYKYRGDLGEALNLYMRVLDMDKVIYGAGHPRFATSLSNVANLYLQLGNLSLAGKLLEECKEIREYSLGQYHPQFIKSVNDLGVYYLLVEDTVAAMEEFHEALIYEIRHMKDIFPVLTDNQRKLYFNETRSSIERYCSLAFADQFMGTIYAEQALNHYINTKGMLFYASEKMRRVIQDSGDEKIIATYNEWRDKNYRLAQLYLIPEDDRRKIGVDIPDLERECEDLEKELAQRFKVFSDQEGSANYTWKRISVSLAPGAAVVDIIQFRNYKVELKGEAIVQGFEDRSNYVAFIIKPNQSLTTHKWAPYIDFPRVIARYQNALKYGLQDTWTYHEIWESLNQKIGDVQKVYFSPDGIFHKVNPSVFYDSEAGEYVLDKYPIVNITSVKDLVNTQPKELLKDALIFGNPNFAGLQIDEILPQLPGAEQEAKEISDILDVRRWDNKLYYFDNATEATLKKSKNPGVIHLATHGFFEEADDPLFSSGLYLSADSEGNDGVLSSYEAMNLVLDQTSLVVLAACETGLGTIENGEGVFGLQRAFLVAGADNVLISLVKINDNAARNFMNLYYQEFLETEDPQRAFFNARNKFKQIDPNPYNWGAYVLVTKAY